MVVLLWLTVGGYHGGAVLRRTAGLLAIGSTTPATTGQVKGAAGSQDHGDVSAREEGQEKVTKRAGGTCRGGGSAGGWEDDQPDLLTLAMAAMVDVVERGGADAVRARPYRCSGVAVACSTSEEHGGALRTRLRTGVARR
jgi:hypothetical protein